jgi:ribosomal-protein-alanine N-acetyltransferase
MNSLRILEKIPTIESNNILLRQLSEKDSTELFNYYSNPNVYRYLDWNGPTSCEEAKEAINIWNNGFIGGKIIRFGIVEKITNKLVGTIFLNNFEGTHAELGYELSEQYWRKGIMTESINLILSLGFNILNLERIQSFVSIENIPSQKLLLKNGFIKEGILRKYEQHHITKKLKDMIIYSILKTDYPFYT